MSTPTRRERIEAMLADEPDDVFLRYGLAMELEKEDHSEESLELLNGLAEGTPPYVPAFFMAGQQLTRIDRPDDARDVLRRGIVEADRQGDAHAAGEMREFLAGISDQ